MATLYSAVLWGGRLGAAVTADDATNYLTKTRHGLRNGTGVAFVSGSLPSVTGTALALGAIHYVKPISLDTFELYRDAALTDKVDFLDIGSSLVLCSAMWLGMSSADRLRYGEPGAERVYDSLAAALLPIDTPDFPLYELVVEVLMAFTDIAQNVIARHQSQSLLITSLKGGTRTEAFHFGIPGSGYAANTTLASGTVISNGAYYVTIDGLEFSRTGTASVTTSVVAFNLPKCVFRNNIVRYIGSGSCVGISLGAAAEAYSNLVFGFTNATSGIGINLLSAAGSALVANNLVTKCGIGLKASDGGALAFNNLAVGNTVNWGNGPTSVASKMWGNMGALQDDIAVSWGSGATLNASNTNALFANQPVTLSSTGTLPSVAGVPLSPSRAYWLVSKTTTTVELKSGRISPASLVFDDAGTGVHTLHAAWSTFTPPVASIDFTNPGDVFVDWENNDFRPAGYGTTTPGSQAKMVDAAVDISQFLLSVDILGNARPAYNNGSAESSDVGPFEFDFGYGPRPASHVLTLSNVVVGSRIVVRNQAKTIVHHDAIAANSAVVITIQVYGDARDYWLVDIRKASAAPFYQRYKTLMTATAGSSSLYINQLPDER